MSIKAKIAEFALLNVVKWIVIIMFAGVVFYFVTPKYEIVQEDKLFNRVTGKIESRKSE